MIGINSQIFSTSGGSMGLSFAIPINIATQVKDQILKNGKVTRGRIGVMIQSLTPELAKGFGLPEDTRALSSREPIRTARPRRPASSRATSLWVSMART